MFSGQTISVLLSGVLAVAWVVGDGMPPESLVVVPGWNLAMKAKDMNQVLPTVFALAAAASWPAAIGTAFTIGLVEESDDGGWLGHEEFTTFRRVFLLLSLTVWRAEKLGNLLERMQRSVGEVKRVGIASGLSQSVSDPFGYLWPALWGSSRRIAPVCISSFGSAPFLRTAFPAVIVDEFLWFALSKIQGTVDRHVIGVPMFLDVVVLPIVDLLHLVPVIVQVLFLGLFEYPECEIGGRPIFLTVCAFAWTAQNLHIAYTTALVDVPESARQLWAQ